MPFSKALVDGIIVFHTARNARCYNHRPGLSSNFAFSNYLFVEMLHHHSSLFRNSIFAAFNETAKFFLRPLFVKHWVVLDSFHQLIKTVNGCVILKHIQNKTFLDCLLHRVDMEWPVLDVIAVLIRNAESFKRLIFRRSGKGKVAGIAKQLAPLHHSINLILIVEFVIRRKARKGKVHLG